MLNPWRLVVLRAVLDAGSINDAARNLRYSPATISQHMTALAAETGLVLFEKQGRGIVATDAARALAEQARSVLADFERLERVVADLRGGEAEYFAIACFASAAEQWMSAVVKAMRESRPNLTVEISLNEPAGGRGRRMPDLDIRTEQDGGIELHLDGFERHELVTERFVAALPVSHRLANADQIELRDLAEEAWVDHDIYDSPIGQIVLSACAAVGFTPRFAARLDDHRAALRLVEAGIGIALLPRLAAEQHARGVVYRPVTQPAIQRRVVVHARRDPQRRSLVELALETLHSVAAPASN